MYSVPCVNLASLAIPAGVTAIDELAFSGCASLALTVAEGSFAETYARENGIPYVYNAE